MIAKFDGTCVLTSQPFVAGETEIAKLGNSGWVVAEYANTEAAAAYVTEQLQAALELARQHDLLTSKLEMYLGRMAELQPITKPTVRPDITIMNALHEARDIIELAHELAAE